MMHVFISHSNLTKMIIESLIKDLNLNKEQVLILSFRSSFINDYLNLDLEDLRKKNINLFSLPFIRRVFKFFKIQKVIKEVDHILKIQTNFTLYTPQVLNPYFQIIASNKYCKKINFIEEGTASYLWNGTIKRISFFKKILKRFLYLNRLPSHSFFDANSFIKSNKTIYYGFSEYAFPNEENKRTVSLMEHKPIIEDGSLIYIMDAAVEFKVISKKDLLHSVKCFIEDYKDHDNISIKFHPQQSDEIRIDVMKILTEYFVVNIINPEVILEKEFLSFRKELLTVTGNLSTLLIYAKSGGHCVKSYCTSLNYMNEQAFNTERLYKLLKIETFKLNL